MTKKNVIPLYADDETRPLTPSEMVEERFTKTSANTDNIVLFMRGQLRKEIDIVERDRATNALHKATGLGKRTIAKLWDQAKEKELARELQVNPKLAAKPPCVAETDFHTIIQYARLLVDVANKREERLFDHAGRVCVIRKDNNGVSRAHVHNEAGFAHELNRLVTFKRNIGDTNAQRGVSAPKDVVAYLYSSDFRGWLPELATVSTCPHFTADGRLLEAAGYDMRTKTYLAPPDALRWGKVPSKPNFADVQKAKRILIDDVLGDFPLDGLTRPEIEQCSQAERASASVANAVATILLLFMREMIEGATPGHVLTKPAPGTGAGYLAGVTAIIGTGSRAPALAFPSNKDEVGKVLTSVLSNDQKIIFFDNIPKSMDSDALAMAMTERYQDRLLGGNRLVDVDVRAQWIFTANNIRMSGELVRRCMMIELDAKMANPEERVNFKHGDILKYVTQHRGEIVWACLTLIQNWVALGKKLHDGPALGNFTEWSQKMGGVLAAAEIMGFLDNRDDFKSYAQAEGEGEVQTLMNALAAYPVGTIFRPNGTSALQREGDKKLHGTKDAQSLLDVLNTANNGSPLLIDGWGYNRDDGKYNTSKGVTGPFTDAARRPWRCELDGDKTAEINFTMDKDKNGPFFVLGRVSAIDDDNGDSRDD